MAEVTADLQRVHAEYANYRKRVERDRELVRETAVASTLAELLPCSTTSGAPVSTESSRARSRRSARRWSRP